MPKGINHMTGRKGREFHRKKEKKWRPNPVIILAHHARRTWKKLFEQLNDI